MLLTAQRPAVSCCGLSARLFAPVKRSAEKPPKYKMVMKKLHVFSFRQRSEAALIKEILAGEGIACLLRNDELSSGLGEIPFIECYPELWVVDDETFPRAKMLLEAWLKHPPDSAADWTCPQCGEHCESQFGACWACGYQRD